MPNTFVDILRLLADDGPVQTEGIWVLEPFSGGALVKSHPAGFFPNWSVSVFSGGAVVSSHPTYIGST